MELQIVPIQRITLDKEQPRLESGLSDDSLKSLAESMKHTGLQQIPTGYVVMVGKGKNKSERILVKDGARRIMAAKLLGWKTIPLMVIDAQKSEDKFLGQMAANTSRENLSPKEEILAVKKAMDFGLTAQSIGLGIGKSPQTVEGLLALSALDTEFLTLIDKGELQKEIAHTLLTLPANERKEAWEWMKKGKSVAGRLAKLEAYKESKKGGVEPAVPESLQKATKALNRLFSSGKKIKTMDAKLVAESRKSDLDSYESEIKALAGLAEDLMKGLREFKARKGKEV